MTYEQPQQPRCVILLGNMSSLMNDTSLRNWYEIKMLLPKDNLSCPQLDLVQTHDSIFYKIRFADYHLSILQQIYRPDMLDPGGDIDNWVRAEMHSIIYNLYSALDSLGYEINLAYGFNIERKKINIYHHKNHNDEKNCLRCKIKDFNDDLTSYIETSLKEDTWFNYFHRLRIQITHRSFPVKQRTMVIGDEGGGTLKMKLPDIPEKINPGQNDYSRGLELCKYCEDTREYVREFIENVYTHIKPKIPEIIEEYKK
jgi:hypothetical protein